MKNDYESLTHKNGGVNITYTMLRNWKPYIRNSFDVPFSNGFTEGCNNATKILKRVCFGISNFNHLRTRILLANDSYPNI